MNNLLKVRTKAFGVSVIKFVREIQCGKVEDIIIRHLVRSATSVGANYRSALRSRGMPDFISRISIAEEEADECCYWLEIIIETGIIQKEKLQLLYDEACQITAMLTATGRTAKRNYLIEKGKKDRDKSS